MPRQRTAVPNRGPQCLDRGCAHSKRPLRGEAHALQLEKARTKQRRPSAIKGRDKHVFSNEKLPNWPVYLLS